MLVFWSRRRITLSQRCHNVVFPTSLLRWKTNVVTTTSCFRRRLCDLTLTLQQRRDSYFFFLTKFERCSDIIVIFFFQDIHYWVAIPFLDKQNLFCMGQCKAFAQMVNIWKFPALCLKREKGFLILRRSETAPCFLVVNSLGSWFSYFLRSGNQYMGIIPICWDGLMKPFKFILV